MNQIWKWEGPVDFKNKTVAKNTKNYDVWLKERTKSMISHGVKVYWPIVNEFYVSSERTQQDVRVIGCREPGPNNVIIHNTWHFIYIFSTRDHSGNTCNKTVNWSRETRSTRFQKSWLFYSWIIWYFKRWSWNCVVVHNSQKAFV